jgi:hypothetical protein
MSVEISALATLRILKHCSGTDGSTSVSGCLLGLDNDKGDVEITNAFVHPARGAADFQPQEKADDSTTVAIESVTPAANFQSDMLKLLKSANMDANIVGWFQSSNLSSFVNEATVDIQFDYQNQNGNAIMIVAETCDVTKSLKAYRLSSEYMRVMRTMRDRKNQSPATLITGGPVEFSLSKNSVFVEVPLVTKLSILDEAYVFENRGKIPATISTFKDSSSLPNAISQLTETVEDLGIEKVRWSTLAATKAGTRIRGEDEVKRLQSANDMILLAENAKMLSKHVQHGIEESRDLCRLYRAGLVE